MQRTTGSPSATGACGALDLGTTNTRLARWDERAERPDLVELPALCRGPRGDDRAGGLSVASRATEKGSG